jgi:hypothetical protein
MKRAKKISVCAPEGWRLLGNQRRRWECNIIYNIIICGNEVNWTVFFSLRIRKSLGRGYSEYSNEFTVS